MKRVPHARSPTAALLLGLIITLAAVVAYSWYISRQISGLRQLQTELDRPQPAETRSSCCAFRTISISSAWRCATCWTPISRYPLMAWSAQFGRIRRDLEDALRREEQVAVARRTPEQRQLSCRGDHAVLGRRRSDVRARGGRAGADARDQVRVSLQARQAALSASVARLLVQNNENEKQTAQQVQEIYRDVQRQVYWFLAAALAAIVVTSLYLIRVQSRPVRATRDAVRSAARIGADADRDPRVDAFAKSRANCTTSSARC